MQKFTSQGVFIRQWGSLGSSSGKFQYPGAVAVSPSGQVYVTDDLNRVQQFDSNGLFQRQWGSDGVGNGQFFGPAGVAVDPSNGSVYVSDNLNERIQKFTAQGTFLTVWGTQGNGAGQFDSPRGLDVDSQGNVYVADTNNDRIQKFVYSVTGVPSDTPMISARLLRAFPNPARGKVGLEVDLLQGEMALSAHRVEAQVFDVAGRLVDTIPSKALNGPGVIWWEPQGATIPPGVYMIRVVIDGSSIGTAKVLRLTP
jgi:DNA-binding beta-propeller fold protein YncE